MAIQTGGWRPATGGTEGVARAMATVRRYAGEYGLRLMDGARALGRRIGRDLYHFVTRGPLIRLVSKTLLRRIMFANLIGLAVLLSGVFYLAQYRAGLIEAQGDGLKVQGESFASLIAFNATREEGTGRIIINPDMLPEIEGANKLMRDETPRGHAAVDPAGARRPAVHAPAGHHARPRLRHRRRPRRRLRPALEERPADGPRQHRSRRPARRPPARQDGLDPLHGVAAARADPGLPGGGGRQRQVLPRGGRGSEGRTLHRDPADHGAGAADRVGGDADHLPRRGAGRPAPVDAPRRDRRGPAGGAQQPGSGWRSPRWRRP